MTGTQFERLQTKSYGSEKSLESLCEDQDIRRGRLLQVRSWASGQLTGFGKPP